MHRLRLLARVLSISTLVLVASCRPDRPVPAEEEAHAPDPASTTVFGERLLLYLQHPHLVRGAPARFLVHLTVLATGEPLRTGKVTLEIGASRLSVDAPESEGLYVPEGSLPEAGTFRARLVVEGADAPESLDLGEIVVHADERGAQDAARSQAGDEPPDAVHFSLEPQWQVKLLLAEAGQRTLDERLVVPARAVAPEGMSAVVSAPVAGRLAPASSDVLPRTGDRVVAGETLALLEPPLGAPEIAQLHALELELDLKALDVLRAAGEAETRLRFAERERERIAKLRAEGLSTQQQLEQAEQVLSLARTELEAAGRMKQSLDRLVARRGAANGAEPAAPIRFPLAAPIAGLVVEVLGVPGLAVEAGEPVFRVLDPSRVWVEGRVSEFDVASLGQALGAVAQFAAIPARRFELRGPRDGKPYLGHEVDPESRTLLVRYELENADGAVRPGMLAELHVSTGERVARVAIPVEAVVVDQGLPTAYVMLEGELFQKRALELGAKDASWVEVLRGVEPGERVATRGAYVVRLAALSGASFGAGHAH